MTEDVKKITIDSGKLEQISIERPGNYVIELVTEGSEVKIFGAFRAELQERINVRVTIHHRAAHTRAQTTLKGAASERASISYTGKIVIDENCPDVQSFLTERILLLSDTAHAEAVPELEILSDDVKCSHAASISRIPEEHLFYLMSRGISRANAERMIVEGFLEQSA